MVLSTFIYWPWDVALFPGHAVFVPHAMLLRGTLHCLWREDEKALKDLRDLVTRQGVEKKVQQRLRYTYQNIHGNNMYSFINVQICVGALVRQAMIFASQKRMEKCEICFQKALAMDSNAVDIFIHRGRVRTLTYILFCHTHWR